MQMDSMFCGSTGRRTVCSIVCRQTVYQFLQWSQLLFLDQLKFLNKKYEMFEGCVQMSFFAQIHYFSEKQNERNTELLQVKPISAE